MNRSARSDLKKVKKPENKQVLVLGITKYFDKEKKQTKICLAGIDIKTKEWIRPINSLYSKGDPDSNRFLKIDDLDCNGRMIQPYNIVEYNFDSKFPNSPHVEDTRINPAAPPRIIRSVSDDFLRRLFNEIACDVSPANNLEDFLLSNNRSLILIKPDNVSLTRKRVNVSYRPYPYYKLHVKIDDFEYNPRMKDLRFRAFYNQKRDSLNDINNLLKNREVYLSIGLTRKFGGKHYPMVIGVHILPDYNNNIYIDYKSLKPRA